MEEDEKAIINGREVRIETTLTDLKKSKIVSYTQMLQKERDFSNLYNSKYCLLTGNATTALYLTIKSLKLKKNSKILYQTVLVNMFQ